MRISKSNAIHPKICPRRISVKSRHGTNYTFIIFALALVVVGATIECAFSANDSAAPFNEKHYQSTYKMVESLINKSSIMAASQTPANSADNGETQKDARYYFEQAKKAHEQGDKQRAAELLEQAKKAMFSAGKKAGNSGAHEQKIKQDTDKKIASAEAMLDALKRIHKEKPRGEEGVQLEKQVADKISQSKQSQNQSQNELAKKQADAAFLLAKQSVINLRDGDTLVRSLNFANKEEEYRYELDRNNTHKMLVTLLLQDKMDNPDVKRRVDEKMLEADQFRQKAESAAKQSKFEDAVGLLEESTKYIIHAIRAAGIYIPG